MRKIIVGSRGSKLALTQTNHIVDCLNRDIEVKIIQTKGDNITDVALSKIEGKGFFTKELDDALLAKEIDFAVHSLKDLPTEQPEGIIIASVPERESPLDALVSKYSSLDELPPKANVGTSSLRRKALLLHIRPDLKVTDLRGNLDTRIRKLNEGQYDAIIVAEAGLKRLGFTDYKPLNPKTFIPAAGQGALAITSRADDEEMNAILADLENETSRVTSSSERVFLAELEGGCQVPAGAYTEMNLSNDEFQIFGFVSSLDGKRYLVGELCGKVSESKSLAIDLAQHLLEGGGREILTEIRQGGI